MTKINHKYDEIEGSSYSLLIIVGIIIFYYIYFPQTIESNIFLRAIILMICLLIASSQNRSMWSFGIAAIIAPGLTLLIQSFLATKIYPPGYKNLNNDKKSEINRDYAYKLYENDKSEKALHFINKAIKLSPNKPYSHYYKGIILNDQGEFELALHSLNKAIDIDPGENLFHIERARSYDNLGNVQFAINDYKSAMDDENIEREEKEEATRYLEKHNHNTPMS